MKKLLIFPAYVVCLTIAFVAGMLYQRAEQERAVAVQAYQQALAVSQTNVVVHEEDGSFSVAYTNFNGHAVSLEFDAPTKRIALKAKSEVRFEFGGTDHSLEFLKDEVARLTSATNVVTLANGYSLQFNGGYPTWAPYTANYKSGIFRCLMFAEGASVTSNKVIVVSGLISKPLGYYPYLASK